MINERPTILLSCAVIATGLVFGCSKSSDATPVQSSLTTSTRGNLEEAASAYEAIRGSLARDRSDVRTQALALADAAQAAATSAPEAIRQPLGDLSSASRRLAGLERDDLEGARRAFGDVSRAWISVLSAEPSLQQGKQVYECPMAKGYKRWVQVGKEASNPYLGSEMLQCGNKIDF